MKMISFILFFSFNLYLIQLSEEESIFINPHKSNIEYNPINYIILVKSDSVQSIMDQTNYNILQHYEKSFYDSYVITPNFFVLNDKSDKEFLLFENTFYPMSLSSTRDSITLLNKSISDFKFIDYINNEPQETDEITHEITEEGRNGSRGSTKPSPTYIIIYGIKDKKICFYYLDLNKYLYSDIDNIDTSISCKLLENNYFICIYSQNDQIKVSILNNTN